MKINELLVPADNESFEGAALAQRAQAVIAEARPNRIQLGHEESLRNATGVVMLDALAYHGDVRAVLVADGLLLATRHGDLVGYVRAFVSQNANGECIAPTQYFWAVVANTDEVQSQRRNER